MKYGILLSLIFGTLTVFADQLQPLEPEQAPPPTTSTMEENPVPVGDANAPLPVPRDPAQDSVPGKKANDEELRVMPALPDAVAKRDMHSMQLEIYKQLFNKEMKPDGREDVEE